MAFPVNKLIGACSMFSFALKIAVLLSLDIHVVAPALIRFRFRGQDSSLTLESAVQKLRVPCKTRLKMKTLQSLARTTSLSRRRTRQSEKFAFMERGLSVSDCEKYAFHSKEWR